MGSDWVKPLVAVALIGAFLAAGLYIWGSSRDLVPASQADNFTRTSRTVNLGFDILGVLILPMVGIALLVLVIRGVGKLGGGF